MSKAKSFLKDNPGYFKWGKNKLANYLGVTVDEILQAKKELRETDAPRVVKSPKHVHVNVPGVHFVFPDLHAPGHNKRFLKAALDLCSEFENIAGLHISGDFLDMNSLSSHDKGKVGIKDLTLDYEYKVGNEVMDQILAKINPRVKTFIYGNHEDRWFRANRDVDTSKFGLPSPTEALKLRERGFEVLEDWKQGTVTLGHYLDLIHGEFITTHTAKKHIDTYRRSVAFGHSHRVQTFIEGSTGGYNIGHMSDADHPIFNYATRSMKNSWLNGFMIVTIDEDGFFHPEIITWYNNKLFYKGKKYE